MDNIIGTLNSLKGLHGARELSKDEKIMIFNLEDKHNTGVEECLNRQHTVSVHHDSTFREPAGKIVDEKDGEKIFPPVPFPEVRAKNVVSSSPGKEVDIYLREKIYPSIPEKNATLLIGFD